MQNENNDKISGGISGAIVNFATKEAELYAIKEYERIRNDEHDIDRIVDNTGYQRVQIDLIKSYLFYNKHKKDNEAMELSLVMQGIPQNLAHNITEQKYNYTRAADEYYKKLRLTQSRKHKETYINGYIYQEVRKLIEESNAREDKKQSKRNGGN